MRQNQNLKRIAEQLAKAGLVSFEEVEKAAKLYGLPTVVLFLETNDAFLRLSCPDVWKVVESLGSEDDLYIE